MGIFDSIKKVLSDASIAGNILKIADGYYEEILSPFGLKIEEIEKETIQNLEKGLKVIDDLFARKESFSSIWLTVTPDGKISISPTNEGYEVNIGSTLLRRKAVIVERIKQLQRIENVGTLRGLVEAHVAEPARAKLMAKIEATERETAEWRIKGQEISAAQEKEKSELESEFRRMEYEGKRFEKRVAVWQSFLSRESLASIVGSILLVGIASALIVAMFIGTKTMDIVNNSFLVLLGYFFGQTVSKKIDNDDSR